MKHGLIFIIPICYWKADASEADQGDFGNTSLDRDVIFFLFGSFSQNILVLEAQRELVESCCRFKLFRFPREQDLLPCSTSRHILK